MDEVDPGAQLVGDGPESGRGEAQVDDPLQRIVRGDEGGRALRVAGDDGRALGLRIGRPQEGVIGLGHHREGEPPPEQVALRPLHPDARAVGQREAQRRLEALGRAFPELHLERLLRLADLRVARRQDGAEKDAGAQECLLAPVEHVGGEDVALLQIDQVEDEGFLGLALPDDFDEADAHHRAGLDPVAHLHARELLPRLGVLVEALLVLDARVEMAPAGEDLGERRAAFFGEEIAERLPFAQRDGGGQFARRRVPAALDQDVRHPGLLAFRDGNGHPQPVRVALDRLRPGRTGASREVSLALVEVLDLLERAGIQDRVEHRLGLGARAGPARLGKPPGDLGRVHRPGIGAHRRIGSDAVAQLLQDALAQLAAFELLVAGEDQLLDEDRPVLVDAEHDLHRPVPSDDLPLGDSGPQEALADVEAAQARRHLLRRLRVDGLLLPRSRRR